MLIKILKNNVYLNYLVNMFKYFRLNLFENITICFY